MPRKPPSAKRVALEARFRELWKKCYPDEGYVPKLIGFAERKDRPLAMVWDSLLDAVPHIVPHELGEVASLSALDDVRKDRADVSFLWTSIGNINFYRGADLLAALNKLKAQVRPTDILMADEDNQLTIVKVEPLTYTLLGDLVQYMEDELERLDDAATEKEERRQYTEAKAEFDAAVKECGAGAVTKAMQELVTNGFGNRFIEFEDIC